jgi:uncharacterized sporulation protein YeaH/YhbH (DUF444 family)
VSDAVRDRSIKDIQSTQSITIPRKDIAEPTFRHGPGGRREYVHPATRTTCAATRFRARRAARRRRQSGEQRRRRQDDFVFELSREEFMQYFFDDLELPRSEDTCSRCRAGRTCARAGRRTARRTTSTWCARCAALGRRIALGAPLVNELRDSSAARGAEERSGRPPREIATLEAEIHHLRGRIWRIPFIDPFDLRYVNRVKPQPSSQAVMFCLMDVSGSMDEQRKDLPSASSSCCTCS